MPYYGQNMSPADYWNQQQNNQRGNVQNVLNMIMTMKQFKMNQEEKKRKETLEAGKYADEQNRYHQQTMRQSKLDELAMRQGEADILHTGALTEKAQRPLAPTVTAQRQAYAKYLLDNNQIDQKEFDHMYIYGTPPKKEGLTPFQDWSKLSTEMSRNQSRTRNKIGDIGRRINKKREPMSQAEMFSIYAAGGTPDIKIDKQGILNLEEAIEILSRIEGVSYERLLNNEQKRILAYISGNMGKIEKEGLEIEDNQKTGESRIKINGKWVVFK